MEVTGLRPDAGLQPSGGVAHADLGKLREQIGERTVSRLTEICSDPIFVMGPDLRMRHSA